MIVKSSSTRVTVKRLDQVTPAERQVLRRLTLKRNSGMREDILNRAEHLDQVWVFLAKREGRIIGWASARPRFGSHLRNLGSVFRQCDVYTYVNRRFRRQGVGTRLLTKVKSFLRSKRCAPVVYAWDEKSLLFYHSKVKQQIRTYWN
jgi:GNAT superfamily N-acetyltransferase